jgi:hypothetical protein
VPGEAENEAQNKNGVVISHNAAYLMPTNLYR